MFRELWKECNLPMHVFRARDTRTTACTRVANESPVPAWMKSPFYVNFFNIPLKLLTLSVQRDGVTSSEILTGFIASPVNNSASTRARIFLPRSPSLILWNDIIRFITYKCTRYARSKWKTLDRCSLGKRSFSCCKLNKTREKEREIRSLESRDFENRVINLRNSIYWKVSYNYAVKRASGSNYVHVKSRTRRYCTRISYVAFKALENLYH